MSLPTKNQTNRILGYPQDARLLIINADDFGMCNSVNEAIMRTLEAGLVRSTSLMVPCPWSLHAMHFLDGHPEIPFGVHLTVISDLAYYRWGPEAPKEKVPSLVDQAGFFYDFDHMPLLRDQAKFDELEVEFRAQIEVVLTAGLKPTHLDWHSLRFGNRTDIFDLMIHLAKEYGLALRVIGQSSIEKLQSQGFPTIDYDFLDSYLIDPKIKSARFIQLLHELPAGLSEWAVHPGLDNSELLALEPANNHERQADYDFWISQQAQDIVKAEGIILLDYKGLQDIWRKKGSPENKL
ncbi:MAG: polysaccharide deacetylase family protein [Anaerolineaceae bacterium]|nr:polysaccharide deacetylase family protein [Anaerolineaceae bacterium]